MPHEQLERNGVDPAELTPIIEAIGAGDLARGIELTSPELADRLSFSGTPDEVAAKIKAELEGTGVNHFIAAINDASIVKAFTGQTVEGVATVEEQLTLLAEEVMPHFADQPAQRSDVKRISHASRGARKRCATSGGPSARATASCSSA